MADTIFLSGMASGFLVGCFFCFVISRMIKQQVYKGMMQALYQQKQTKKRNGDEDDPVNSWKPKGWKPDY